MVKLFATLSRTALIAALPAALAACSLGSGDPIAEAEQAIAANDYAAARVHLLNALQDDPSGAKANLLFARTLLALGDGIGAESALKKIAGNRDYAQQVPALMGHALLLRDRPDEALDWARKAPAGDPLGHWVRASALLATGDHAAAEAALVAGLKGAPDDPALHALAGNIALDKGDLAAARGSAVRALKYGPEHLDALIVNARLARREGDAGKARGLLETAVKTHPGSVVPMIMLADLADAMGDTKAARRYAKRALATGPTNPDAMLVGARIALDAGDVDGARRLVQGAGEALEDRPGRLLIEGEIAMASGNREVALDTLAKYHARVPGNARGIAKYAEALLAVGRGEDAYALVAEAARRPGAPKQLLAAASKIARATGNPDNFGQRATAGTPAGSLADADRAIAARDWSRAEALYAEARQGAGAKDVRVLNNSALIALERGKGEEAVRFARAAMAAAPGNPGVMDTLGWVLLRGGDVSDRGEALKLLQQASSRAPGDLEIRWHYANALAANGRGDEAKRIARGLRQYADAGKQREIDRLLASL